MVELMIPVCCLSDSTLSVYGCMLLAIDLRSERGERSGSASCSATLPTLPVTHGHTHKTHSSLFVPGCENTGSCPPTLRHPPQEETTPALPVALKQRSQVPCRSPASFVLTAGRKPSPARGHRALGSKRECVCVCASISVVGV